MKVLSLLVQGDSGVNYTVATNANGSVTCECPSYIYQTKWCKHIKFVVDQLGVKPS